MERAEKDQQIAFLADCFSKGQISIVADYKGLSVAEMTDLRRKLRAAGTTSKVVKNTLARRALTQTYKDNTSDDLKKLNTAFDGCNFIAVSYGEVVAPAKVFTDFAKGKDNIKIKGAWFEGAFLDKAAVEQLAKLPSREETLSKLLALINAPATQLVRVLQAPAEQLVRVLDAVRAKLEGQGA